jgi:signal transduction histidine kinase/ActR/RegA family two-component response regulator
MSQPPIRESHGLDAIADPQALLKGLFEHAPVAFQVYKADGHCLLVNQAFREILQSEPPPEYNVLEDDVLERQGFLDLVRRAFAGETIHMPPVWYDPRDLRQIDLREGRRVGIEVTLFPLRDASGVIQHIALCAKDVTAELELRATADALRQSEDQLRQSQKMEAVGKLAGGIAHDFNNLLSVVLSYASLALKSLDPKEPLTGNLKEIRNAAERAAQLTKQLLAFSRQQVLAPAIVDLSEVVTRLDKMLQRLIGEDIELKTVPGSNLHLVKVDPAQIEQVIMNLAVNARDAMPAGGSLTIETANVVLDEAYAQTHPGVRPGPHVLLAVSDTGAGMDAQTQLRIFEPFFTTKEVGKGTGLGLSTVFGIVQQSGGHIGLYSEPDKGSTFKVYFPKTEDLAHVPATLATQPATLAGSETLLLVEDEQQLRNLARVILEKNGYQVMEAQNGEEALLLSERFSGSIDLLVTDVIMPKMNGRQLAEKITASRPTTPVLYISGYTDSTIVRHGVSENGIYFLQKPITPDTLLRKVREVLDRR